MHVESYAVEVQSLSKGSWIEDGHFTPNYKWRFRRRRGLLSIFGLLRRTQPEPEGSHHVLDLIAKASAIQSARKLIRERKPRSVRVVRVAREGARVQLATIWINGIWLE